VKYAFSTLLVAVATGVVVGARAQGDHGAVAPPASSASASGSAAASAAPTTSASIAPPGPSASPQKVEDAKKVAKVAELTPIVPEPKNPLRPAFQLYAEVDLPVLGVGLVFAAARLIRTQQAFCAPLCDPNDLNPLDRTTAGFWSVPWSTASDIGIYSIGLGAAAFLLVDEGPLDALNDAVVIGESALSAAAVSTMLTLAAGRPRPFLYGTAAPLADRNSADASLSFLSSHASVSWAIVTSTFMATKRLNPKSSLPYFVLAIGGGAASFVATARVMAGRHFISDAVGGSIVGASMGFLIPSLHGSPVRIVPVVSDTQRGLGLHGFF
jgi:membrane-associated phospholipid phosphatase